MYNELLESVEVSDDHHPSLQTRVMCRPQDDA